MASEKNTFLNKYAFIFKIYFHRETFSGFSRVTYRTTTSGASPTSSSQEKDSSSHPPFANAIRTADLSNAVFVFR